MNYRSNNYSIDLKTRVIKNYIEEKFSICELVKIFSISKSSIYNWIKEYKTNNKLYKKDNYNKKSSIFRNINIRNVIKKYINENPNFIYTTLIEHINKITNINLKKSTLYNIISDLNISKKKVKFKKVYGNPEKLEEKKKDLKLKIKKIKNSDIISIDEISFDTNIIHEYAWGPKNIPIIKTVGATYKRLTMICAISNKKVIHYKILRNSAKSDTFLEFLKEIPKYYLKNKYLFLDNACIHHSKIVTKYVNDNKIKLIFNVPYTPENNPIEIMFSKLKKIVKDCQNNSDVKTLITNIENSIPKITKNDLNNFYNYSLNKLRDP